MEYEPEEGHQSGARQHLQRAYVLLSFGYVQQARQACRRAAELAQSDDDRLTARCLGAAVLTASGRPRQAMRELFALHRRHKKAVLPALYLAEACFFSGRHRRAWKILDGIETSALQDSPWSAFAEHLRQTWEQLQQLDELPGPLEVPLEEIARQQFK